MVVFIVLNKFNYFPPCVFLYKVKINQFYLFGETLLKIGHLITYFVNYITFINYSKSRMSQKI